MFRRFSRVTSRLYDQSDFYQAFVRDLHCARSRVVIESPFITTRRFSLLYPELQRCARRGVVIVVNTRHPDEHDGARVTQALEVICRLQDLGVTVLYTAGLHRKIAIIDDIVYEGSLNILSQSDSLEIMRRTEGADYARELIQLTKMAKWYNRR